MTCYFFWWIPRGTLSAAYILACLKNWKIILVCFYYTAEWGWDSLHPQINLEGPALSAFYEENPPGDESWEYSQWQGRSCETGWFCPGWTFDGELWFHCAFHSLKGNTINPGLPYSITWQLFCSTTKPLLLSDIPDAELNSVSSRIWKCLFPPSPTYIQKNVAGQSDPAKFNSPQWALILFESRPTLKKHARAARKTVWWG